VGELASPRQAALPVAAALGGMLAPAGIYIALNVGKEGAAGWGIPMATDIAFALGVLALLGKRVPVALKIYLTALAIVDDIGAVLVIALFYTAEIAWISLWAGAAILIVLVAANWAGARHPFIYALLGFGLWLAFLKSGVHATVAGVLLAMTIPSRAHIDAEEFLTRSQAILNEFERAGEYGKSVITNEAQQAAVQSLGTVCEQVETPMQRLEHTLHPWVPFLIMPLFAQANAGVALGGDLLSALTHPVSLGVAGGLVIGQQMGITLLTWLAVKLGLAAMPGGRFMAPAGWPESASPCRFSSPAWPSIIPPFCRSLKWGSFWHRSSQGLSAG